MFRPNNEERPHDHRIPSSFRAAQLIKEDSGDRLILSYDENAAPSYTTHKLLFYMDAHVAMMDATGIDITVVSSAAGMAELGFPGVAITSEA